jgi:hypothetical protein
MFLLLRINAAWAMAEAERGNREAWTEQSRCGRRRVERLVGERMKHRVLQLCLAIAVLLMLFRFGWPALIFGATGPGPFGNRWLSEGRTATLLLDSDLRFFGAMTIGLGFVFLWTISRVDALGPVIYILACAVAVGAAARIYARLTFGDPGTAGTIPVVIEVVLPIVMVFTRYSIGREVKKPTK